MHHKTSTTDVCRSSLWHYALDCSCGYELIFPFIITRLSPCTAPASQLGLKTRCRKQYTTRKAVTTRSESGARVVCCIDCTAFVLHPNATHLEDGASLHDNNEFRRATCGAGVPSDGVTSSNHSYCTSLSYAFVHRTACVYARTANPIESSTSRTRTRTCSRNLAQIILSRCQLPNCCITSSRHTHMQHQSWSGVPSLSIRAYLSCCYNDVRGSPLVCSTRCSIYLNTLRRLPREHGVTIPPTPSSVPNRMFQQCVSMHTTSVLHSSSPSMPKYSSRCCAMLNLYAITHFSCAG
jgi:hypothetical protein